MLRSDFVATDGTVLDLEEGPQNERAVKMGKHGLGRREFLTVASNGYYSEDNVRGVTEVGLDPYFAGGREKHHAPVSVEPAANDATATSSSAAAAAVVDQNPKAAMANKLRMATGRALDAARKHIVEPVFGQIKRIRGFRKFLVRGLESVSAEWPLICLTHNLLKIWRYVSSVS